jgi:hypothetical protein
MSDENDAPAALRIGSRVRLWIGPPKRGGYHYGAVIGIDNLSHKGVQIRFDHLVNGVDNCYATHDEVEVVSSSAEGDT